MNKGYLILGLFLSLLIGFIIYGIRENIAYTTREFEESGYTSAEFIERIPRRKGSDAAFHYTVNGIKYIAYPSYHSGLVYGEKYKIEFNKNDPSDARVLYSEPLFTPEEKTNKTIGTVTDLSKNSFWGNATITFSYKVGNKNFEKWQYREWENYDVKIGDSLEVEYWKYNPERAIIDIESNDKMKE